MPQVSATNTQQRNIRVTVVLLLAFVALLLIGLVWRVQQPKLLPAAELESYGAVIFDVSRVLRDFSLLDETGKPADKTVLQGKWSVLFYGFTHCPDVCPATLAELNQVQRQFVEQGISEKWQVMMIAVDHERDKPERLRPYLNYFNPAFKGLTGADESLQQLAGDTNAAYGKIYSEGGSYTVDHSSQLVLINPKGDYAGFIKGPAQAARVAPVLRSLIYDFERRFQ